MEIEGKSISFDREDGKSNLRKLLMRTGFDSLRINDETKEKWNSVYRKALTPLLFPGVEIVDYD